MISTPSIEELLVNKYLCESSSLNFTRYFFKQNHGKKFIVSQHHKEICDALDKVISGEIKKLIINIAPRYGKTELAVKNFIAYGLAINPKSRFIHLSYSDDLALDNSESIKDIVNLESYRQLFSKVVVKKGSDAKKKWYTTEGGGVYATSAAGQVTGFGAGLVDEEEESDFEFLEESSNKLFSGALIIDDPIKPEDADSETVRGRVNQRWDSTIKNRVNSRNTPIIVIMQRLHEEDLCGYLLGQSSDWTVLSFPCLREDNTALWPFKQTVEELRILEKENEVVFSRQYQQDPKPLKGYLFTKMNTNRFTMDEFEKETINEKKESLISATYGYIDPAEGGGDDLAGLWGAIIPNKVFITDVVFTLDTVEVSTVSCAGIINKVKADYTRIEKNGNGSGYIRDMRRITPPEKILESRSATHKGTRIWNEFAFINKYFYFLADTEYMPGSDYDKFMKNLFAYMKVGDNQKDGAPDATAGLSRMIQVFPSKELFDSSKTV